ncbi:hypothetical protein JRI60_50980 [Archangium violaceum]|uniref:hypothetical protein n=1 Tax=Archangium violaceum TaxID=83451 RepID=UPI00195294D8|nr:hypothetical protein [Archangium violaceum]QRN97184.1 hypothetical protein JRI60_50980 [Archangium violaceum]
MKNVEGPALPVELDRRLKVGVARLKEARKSMEELTRIADAIGPLLGVGRGRRGARAASAPVPAARAQEARPAAAPPPQPARGARTAPSSAPSEDEVPEWRKVFPALSANVPPKRSK